MLMKRNCRTTAFPMKQQENVSSPLVSGHSEERGSGCSKFSQVLLSPLQQTHSLSLLLPRFSSLHQIPMRVFHYPEPNICHGFWKPPLPHFCWRSWCTAASSPLFPISYHSDIFFFVCYNTGLLRPHITRHVIPTLYSLQLLYIMWSVHVEQCFIRRFTNYAWLESSETPAHSSFKTFLAICWMFLTYFFWNWHVSGRCIFYLEYQFVQG